MGSGVLAGTEVGVGAGVSVGAGVGVRVGAVVAVGASVEDVVAVGLGDGEVVAVGAEAVSGATAGAVAVAGVSLEHASVATKHSINTKSKLSDILDIRTASIVDLGRRADNSCVRYGVRGPGPIPASPTSRRRGLPGLPAGSSP